MMKTQFLLLCIAVIPVIYAWPFSKCPEQPTNSFKHLSYVQIGGNWNLVASKPALNGKCMNVTIQDYSLTKTYYSKVLFFFNKKSSTEYTISNEIRPVALNLKSKSWYSFEKEELSLFGVDYLSYALFYTCTPGFLKSYSESYELWTRKDVVDPKNLPTEIIERLAIFNLKPEDLTFRTVKDCSH